MKREWLTLEQAAKHLGVSSRTLRRWIHAGKLHAELRPGPYGQQYVVPLEQLGAVHLVRAVDRAERRRDVESIPQTVENYLHTRDEPLVAGMEALRSELHLAVQRITAGQEAILVELRELRRTLEGTPVDPNESGRG
jgi:excisionase family DNA binding protein